MNIDIILPEMPQNKDILNRYEWIDKGMYAFIAWNWIKPLAEFIGKKKCLEVMAGRGWASMALQHCGVDIVPTDDKSWHKKDIWKETDTVTEVYDWDCVEAIKKFAPYKDYVLMSWPPYNQNIAFQALKTLHEVNPKAILIYIGEDKGGCTADDEFFEHFKEIKRKGFSVVQNNFQSWWGIHDRIMLGKYK